MLSATAFLQSKAADSSRDDAFTVRENCQDSCNRDHTICMDSSGPRLENYGERTSTIGLDGACDNSLRECLHQCGVVSPAKQVPNQAPTGSGLIR
ncbi:MAG: hypothetical protein HY053_05480 [Proteobacteria bacterium]|nr:hypothetical protein [Pseudomonadota bacterium]